MKNLLLAFSCAIVGFVSAQNYTTGIGLKGGYPGGGGINIKHNFGSVFGDFTLGGGPNWFQVNAIAEKQMSLQGGLEWYLGIGAYLTSWRSNYGYYKNNTYYSGGVGIGALGVIGLEYTFDQVPISLAIEGGPSLNFVPWFGFGFNTSGAIRYTLK